jgi:HSP20 family molecular chaperone IbpA
VNLPSVNLKETDTKLEIELAPMVKKKYFKIEVDNNMLIIFAEKQEKKIK